MRSTQVSSKILKRKPMRPSINPEDEEQPYGALGANVSRVRVAHTQIPVEARSAEQLSRMGNVVPMDEKYVEEVRAQIERRARKFRDKITSNIVSTSVGFDQALDWSLVMLKDGFKIDGSISIDVLHLLEAASNIAMLEHITASLHISKPVRAKILEAAIERSMDHAYANIVKDKGGIRARDPSLAGVITGPRMRAQLRSRDSPARGDNK